MFFFFFLQRCLDDLRLSLGCLLLQFAELWAVFNLVVDKQDDGEENCCEPERNAPAPRDELFLCERVGGSDENDVSQERSCRNADLVERARVCPVLRASGFGEEKRKPTPLTACGQTLRKPAKPKRDRCDQTNVLCARQAPDDKCSCTHDEERYDDNWFTAEFVAVVSGNDTANVAKLRRVATSGPSEGKNTCGNTKAAAVP